VELQGGLLRSGGGRRLGSVELEVRRVCGSIGACGDAYHYNRDGNEDPVAKPATCQYVLVLGLELCGLSSLQKCRITIDHLVCS
jgi:hypothetical protein